MKSEPELRDEATSIASALRSAAGNAAEDLGTAIDRNQLSARRVPTELRDRFIALRSELNARGIYDPVLGTFDSATVRQAASEKISQQLELVAEQLQSA